MEDINSEYLTFNSGVDVSDLYALVNGCFYGGAVGAVVAVVNCLVLLTIQAWAVGVNVGSLGSLRSWHNLLDDWRALLNGVDGVTYCKPDRDISPVIESRPVRVYLFSYNGNRYQYANLPTSPE